MNRALTFTRTTMRYTDGVRALVFPIVHEQLDPDVISIDANATTRWTEPAGEAISAAEREEILAFVKSHLTQHNTFFTIEEADYLRARAAPFQLTLEGSRDGAGGVTGG